MKNKFSIILVFLCLFLLGGCGKTVENGNEDSKVTDENSSSEGDGYKIVSEELLKYTDDDGVNVHYLAEIKNTSSHALYFSNMGTSIDIEDKNGELITSNQHIYTRPSVIAAGESGYISEGVVYSRAEGKGLTSDDIGNPILHIEAKKAEEANIPDVVITDSTLNIDSRISIIGRAKSNEKAVLDIIHIIIPVRDENNKLCAVAIGQVENLNSGEQKGFEATELIKYSGDTDKLSIQDIIVCNDGKMFGDVSYR